MNETLTVAQAQERVKAIAANRIELETRKETLEQRRLPAQQQSARRYLLGDRGGLEEGALRHAEMQTIEAALSLLDLDTKQAEADLLGAKARDFRDQAQQKKAELGQLNAKTATVLAELSRLEGVTFTHSILSSQPLTKCWLQWGSVKSPEEWMGLTELQLSYPTPDRKIEVPRSRRLRMEIADLEQQADKLEQELELRQSLPVPAAT